VAAIKVFEVTGGPALDLVSLPDRRSVGKQVLRVQGTKDLEVDPGSHGVNQCHLGQTVKLFGLHSLGSVGC
jgi:hypothetical protein